MNEPMNRPMNRQLELPLLADHHNHPLLYSGLRQAVELSHVKTWDEARDRIAAAGADRNDVVVAHGWRDNHFVIDANELEKLPAAVILNFSLHDLKANRAGLARLADHYGDEVARITDRHWFESNARKVWNWLAMLAASPEGLIRYFDDLEGQGVWSAEELLLIDSREIRWFRETGLIHRTRFWAAPETWFAMEEEYQNDVQGLKLFTDGAIGVRTAALSEPYADSRLDSPNHGMLVYGDVELEKTLDLCASSHRPIAIHAIGDRAIEQTLRALQAVGPERFPEIRIEHAQFISRDQAQRAKRMGIILSMQPNFSDDSVDYADRLPGDFPARNNPFRMLIDQVGFEPGVDLILGSDGMPTGIEPALRSALSPPFDSQRLTLDEFRAGYCAATERTTMVTIPSEWLESERDEIRNPQSDGESVSE